MCSIEVADEFLQFDPKNKTDKTQSSITKTEISDNSKIILDNNIKLQIVTEAETIWSEIQRITHP